MNDDLLELFSEDVSTKNVFGGIYYIEIPFKEVNEDVTIFKLYEARKNGLIYRHKEIVNNLETIKYYDINTGLEITLDRNGKYLPLKSLFFSIEETIDKNTLFLLAKRYEREHLKDSKLLNLNNFVIKNNVKTPTDSIIDIENYYNNSIAEKNNVKKLLK